MEEKRYRRKLWKRGFTCNAQSDPPGRKWPVHRHAVDEIVLLVDGKIEVVVGKKSMHPPQKKAIVIPRHVLHAIHNDGPVEAHYVYGFRNKRR